MRDFFILVGWNLIVTALMTVVAWLLSHTRALRTRPALCHGLWILVLLSLVTPPLVPIPVLPASSAAVADRYEPTASAPADKSDDHAQQLAHDATPDGSLSHAAGPAFPVAKRHRPTSWIAGNPHFRPSTGRRDTLLLALLVSSLLISAIISLAVFRQSRYLGRLVRSMAGESKRAAAIVDELLPVFGNRWKPALVVIDKPIMPMLWAAPRHATIVLPRCVADSADDDELRSIIGHELAHLTRRDGWTQIFALFVAGLQWWNPCAWLARRELRTAAEECCDALVLERLPRLRKTYARTLLSMADRATKVPMLRPATAIEFGASASLKRRIAMVANGNVKSQVSKTGWTTLACAAVLLCSFPTRAQERPKPAASATESDLFKKSTRAENPPPSGEQPERPQGVGPNEIAGVVVDAQGKPLAGVLVDAWTWFTGDETKTDDNGVFRLTPEDDDEPYVEVRFSKEGYSPHYVAQQPRGEKGLVVTLDDKTYIEGTLRGPDGKSVAGATIKAMRGHWRWPNVRDRPAASTTTGADGHYRLYVFPQTYDIHVAQPGTGVARISDVIVTAGQAQPLDIQLEPGVRFEARVVNANSRTPVEEFVLFDWRDENVHGVSDEEGKIVIEGMLPGEYKFSVGSGKPKRIRGQTVWKHGKLGRWWSADAIQPWQHKTIENSGWQRNFDRLTFDLSLGMQPVTIEVERGVVFSGHVYDPEGNAVEGATVAPAKTGSGNSLTGDTRYSVKTNSDGSYRVVMPAGNQFAYNLIAHDGGYSKWRRWANAVTAPMKTQPGQRVEDLDITLNRGATVRGRIVGDDDPVGNRRKVRAHAADLRGNRYYDPTVKVREDGSFELKFIRPGKHYIQVAPFWLRASGAPDQTSVVVELEPDQVLEGIELHVASENLPPR